MNEVGGWPIVPHTAKPTQHGAAAKCNQDADPHLVTGAVGKCNWDLDLDPHLVTGDAGDQQGLQLSVVLRGEQVVAEGTRQG